MNARTEARRTGADAVSWRAADDTYARRSYSNDPVEETRAAMLARYWELHPPPGQPGQHPDGAAEELWRWLRSVQRDVTVHLPRPGGHPVVRVLGRTGHRVDVLINAGQYVWATPHGSARLYPTMLADAVAREIDDQLRRTER